MRFFEIEADDISDLDDRDLRELVGRLCEAELVSRSRSASCVTYIAPVFPDTALTLLGFASRIDSFVSRANPSYDLFVRLLCHLAYEDEDFDKAAAILLKFAESEKQDEKTNNIVQSFQQLFALRLSGTRASPKRRQAFIKRLLEGGSRRHREIADRCLHSAFGASHWTSSLEFGFGARQRDLGWERRCARV